MQVARLVGLERLVLRSGVASLQVTQIAHPMPPQAAVEARARHIRVQEFADNGEQVVDGHQQRLAQNGRHRLLRRRQRGLQPVRRVAAVMHTVAMLPLVDGLLVCRENDSLDRFLTLQTPEPFRQGRRRLRAGLDRSPHLRGRRRLLVKMDQHARTPL